MDQSGMIRIIATDGRLIYQRDYEQYEAIDLSRWSGQVLVVEFIRGDEYYRQIVFSN